MNVLSLSLKKKYIFWSFTHNSKVLVWGGYTNLSLSPSSSPLLPFPCSCNCVCVMDVYTSIRMNFPVCAFTQRGQISVLNVFLNCSPACFWEWISHHVWSSPFWLEWLAISIGDLPVCPSSASVTEARHHAQRLYGCWGSEFTSPRLQRKHICSLSRLPSWSHNFLISRLISQKENIMFYQHHVYNPTLNEDDEVLCNYMKHLLL